MQHRSVALAFAASALALASCAGADRGSAVDPTVFHYPTGITLDPGGDWLYVVSTNFDDQYHGGTVLPISLAAFDQLLPTALSGAPGEPPRVPLTDPKILPPSAIEIHSFGGDVAIQAGIDGKGAEGFVAARGGDVVEFFGITRKAGKPILDCGAGDGVVQCGSDHQIGLTWNDPLGLADPLPGRDPFALTLGLGLGNGAADSPETRVAYAGSILDGTVALLKLDAEFQPTLVNVVSLLPGIHSIVEGPLVAGRRVVYVSNRLSNVIHVVELARDGSSNLVLAGRDALSVPEVSSSGDYFRGIALSRDQRRLYAACRSPTSLAVFDVDATGAATLRGLVPLHGAPSMVAVGDEGGSERVFVTDFAGAGVYVVDPAGMDVTDRIAVGPGPYGIVLAEQPPRAFITLFEDNSLSVVDLGDSGSATFHTEIARIK